MSDSELHQCRLTFPVQFAIAHCTLRLSDCFSWCLDALAVNNLFYLSNQ